MEGRIDMLDFIWNIISSDKFYLPVIFIFIGIVSYKIISKTVKKVGKFNNYIGKGHSKGYDKRRDTVIGLINNIIKYIIAIIVVILILNLYGVNTRSIVASIGIAGAIIGLAFQDIIKDFLAGVFIIFDNEYAVGDWIKIDDFRGEVISIGLKTTKIRAYTGEIMILSNSSFNKIINYNLNPPSIYIQIPFGYDEKIEKVEEVLSSVLVEIGKEKDVKKFELLGVESFEDDCIYYSIYVSCAVGTQFAIKRLLLKKIKMAFDEAGIVIPYNQLDVHIDK